MGKTNLNETWVVLLGIFIGGFLGFFCGEKEEGLKFH